MVQARESVQVQCRGLHKSFGDVLGLSCEDIVWGLGHVMSRAFGTTPDVGLAPFIDMINHQQHAAKPAGIIMDDDEVRHSDRNTNHFLVTE